MVKLDDGWIAIVEQLIEIDLEERKPAISLGPEGTCRLRSEVLARVDTELEQQIAVVLERVVLEQLRRMPDGDLRDLAAASGEGHIGPVDVISESDCDEVDLDPWSDFEEMPD